MENNTTNNVIKFKMDNDTEEEELLMPTDTEMTGPEELDLDEMLNDFFKELLKTDDPSPYNPDTNPNLKQVVKDSIAELEIVLEKFKKFQESIDDSFIRDSLGDAILNFISYCLGFKEFLSTSEEDMPQYETEHQQQAAEMSRRIILTKLVKDWTDNVAKVEE